MKHISIVLLFVFFFLKAEESISAYKKDILKGCEQLTILQPDDYEGKVVSTLLRKKANTDSVKKAVLYIHGYCDYFFQEELANALVDSGYNFYALELRKYGRSLLDHQSPNMAYSLKEYFPDLDSALYHVSNEGNEQITILAHSTGGLVATYYLKENQTEQVDALILNSPFLDMNNNWFMENIVIPVASWLGSIFPKIALPMSSGGMYGKTLHEKAHGVWDYKLEYKPLDCFDMNLGWLRAITTAQKEIQEGIDSNLPVLVLSSDTTISANDHWDEAYKTADIVLDVEDIKEYGSGLGDAQVVQIKDAVHDVFLSSEEVRTQAYMRMFHWLEKLN